MSVPKPASYRAPEFCGLQPFPVSHYVWEYVLYLDASCFTDTFANDPGLTIRDIHNVFRDTEVAAWVKLWLHSGGRVMSVYVTSAPRVIASLFAVMKRSNMMIIYRRLCEALTGGGYQKLDHCLWNFVTRLVTCILLRASITLCSPAALSSVYTVIYGLPSLASISSNCSPSRGRIGVVNTSKLRNSIESRGGLVCFAFQRPHTLHITPLAFSNIIHISILFGKSRRSSCFICSFISFLWVTCAGTSAPVSGDTRPLAVNKGIVASLASHPLGHCEQYDAFELLCDSDYDKNLVSFT